MRVHAGTTEIGMSGGRGVVECIHSTTCRLEEHDHPMCACPFIHMMHSTSETKQVVFFMFDFPIGKKMNALSESLGTCLHMRCHA